MSTNVDSDTLGLMGSPGKVRRRVVGRISCFTKGGLVQLGCVSQDYHPRMSISTERRNLDQITPSNFPRERGTTSKVGKEGVHRDSKV